MSKIGRMRRRLARLNNLANTSILVAYRHGWTITGRGEMYPTQRAALDAAIEVVCDELGEIEHFAE